MRFVRKHAGISISSLERAVEADEEGNGLFCGFWAVDSDGRRTERAKEDVPLPNDAESEEEESDCERDGKSKVEDDFEPCPIVSH